MTTSYTSVFGGSTITPADASYSAVTLSADATLSWPNSIGGTAPFATDTIDVNATVSGKALTLPDATLVSVGTELVFNGVGSNTFTINNHSGSLVATVASTVGMLVYLTDNSTAAGVWRAVQLSTGTSSAQASLLAGAGTNAVGGVINEAMPISTFSSNYTTGLSDRATTLVWTGGAGTLSIPAVATLTNDWFVGVKNAGTGNLTLSPASGTIDGAASVSLSPNDSCRIFSDGTNLQTFARGRSAAFSFSFISIDVSGTGDYTLSTAQLNQICYKFTGTLTGNRNIIVPNSVQQYWVQNTTSGAYTLTVKTAAGTGASIAAAGQNIMWCDGTNVIAATQNGTSPSAIPVPVSEGGTNATTASAARTNLGATSTGAALFTATDAAAGRTALSVSSTDQSRADALAFALVI